MAPLQGGQYIGAVPCGRRPRIRFLPLFLLLFGFPFSEASGQGPSLGPKDPARLPATDTSRVAVGMEAPDFTLEALSGPALTLSQFRGKQNVILVFYRGHW
jgi:cytochrome oxidase Cu insertion factor (SCO1/SenC/PrrC family)